MLSIPWAMRGVCGAKTMASYGAKSIATLVEAFADRVAHDVPRADVIKAQGEAVKALEKQIEVLLHKYVHSEAALACVRALEQHEHLQSHTLMRQLDLACTHVKL